MSSPLHLDTLRQCFWAAWVAAESASPDDITIRDFVERCRASAVAPAGENLHVLPVPRPAAQVAPAPAETIPPLPESLASEHELNAPSTPPAFNSLEAAEKLVLKPTQKKGKKEPGPRVDQPRYFLQLTHDEASLTPQLLEARRHVILQQADFALLHRHIGGLIASATLDKKMCQTLNACLSAVKIARRDVNLTLCQAQLSAWMCHHAAPGTSRTEWAKKAFDKFVQVLSQAPERCAEVEGDLRTLVDALADAEQAVSTLTLLRLLPHDGTLLARYLDLCARHRAGTGPTVYDVTLDRVAAAQAHDDMWVLMDGCTSRPPHVQAIIFNMLAARSDITLEETIRLARAWVALDKQHANALSRARALFEPSFAAFAQDLQHAAAVPAAALDYVACTRDDKDPERVNQVLTQVRAWVSAEAIKALTRRVTEGRCASWAARATDADWQQIIAATASPDMDIGSPKLVQLRLQALLHTQQWTQALAHLEKAAQADVQLLGPCVIAADSADLQMGALAVALHMLRRGSGKILKMYLPKLTQSAVRPPLALDITRRAYEALSAPSHEITLLWLRIYPDDETALRRYLALVSGRDLIDDRVQLSQIGQVQANPDTVLKLLSEMGPETSAAARAAILTLSEHRVKNNLAARIRIAQGWCALRDNMPDANDHAMRNFTLALLAANDEATRNNATTALLNILQDDANLERVLQWVSSFAPSTVWLRPRLMDATLQRLRTSLTATFCASSTLTLILPHLHAVFVILRHDKEHARAIALLTALADHHIYLRTQLLVMQLDASLTVPDLVKLTQLIEEEEFFGPALDLITNFTDNLTATCMTDPSTENALLNLIYALLDRADPKGNIVVWRLREMVLRFTMSQQARWAINLELRVEPLTKNALPGSVWAAFLQWFDRALNNAATAAPQNIDIGSDDLAQALQSCALPLLLRLSCATMYLLAEGTSANYVWLTQLMRVIYTAWVKRADMRMAPGTILTLQRHLVMFAVRDRLGEPNSEALYICISQIIAETRHVVPLDQEIERVYQAVRLARNGCHAAATWVKRQAA